MISERPFNEFKKQCEQALKDALKRSFPEFMPESVRFAVPPKPEMGDLGSSTPFEISGKINRKPFEVASKIAENIDPEDFPLVDSAVSIGGYINFLIEFPRFASLTINSIRELGDSYGFVKSDEALRIIVEHTSVNPIHPIHIGQARNPILGDAIARILSARGHEVYRHYYIDDVGRQSAIIAYGYDKLGRPESHMKADHLIGIIYAVTSCLIELSTLSKGKRLVDEDERIRQLEDWRKVAEDLKGRYPDLFSRLESTLATIDDPEEEIRELMRKYELGDKETKDLVRKVANLCLEGF